MSETSLKVALTAEDHEPLSSGQTTEIGTMVQRRMSPATSRLSHGQAKKLLTFLPELDKWALTWMRIRVSGVCVYIKGKSDWVSEVEKVLRGQVQKSRITFVDHPAQATVCVSQVPPALTPDVPAGTLFIYLGFVATARFLPPLVFQITERQYDTPLFGLLREISEVFR